LGTEFPVPVGLLAFSATTVGAPGVDRLRAAPAPRQTMPSPFRKVLASPSVMVVEVALIEHVVVGTFVTARIP
jgi:hypothetical protein